MPDFRAMAVGTAVASLLGLNAMAAAPSDSAAKPDVEPAAIAGMDRMSAALKMLTDVAFDADVTSEVVLATGQKLQYAGTLSVTAHRPTGLKISATSDTNQRDFYYDGKTLTIVSPRLKYYATVPAPETIALMLDEAKSKYGVELPLADLFTWDTNPAIQAGMKSGYVIRPETINGESCMHYAFRQKTVDWQIWIEEAPAALPCKLVITNTEDSSMPQYSAVLKWHRPGTVDTAAFHYVPSGDTHPITIADTSQPAGKAAAKPAGKGDGQ